MDSLHLSLTGRESAPCQDGAGNILWDAGFESWKCELHRYTEQEIRLDRCARGGDRLRVEAVRATEHLFSVAYTVCPSDSERPKCVTLVSGDFDHWHLAVQGAKDSARAFLSNARSNPGHAVLGHWNAYHVIDDETELQAWRWDGESVFELRRQTLLLDCFPERLQEYALTIPAELVVPQEIRRLADASPEGFRLSVVAVDSQGFALLQTNWCAANGYCPGPEYVVLSARAATATVKRYCRQFLRMQLQQGEGQTARRAP